jgi:hypothetical protein
MQVVCETVFHKHLGPKGTYSLHGSAFYIFRFGRLNAAEARRRARLAVDEIGHNLLSPHFIPFAEEELTKPSTEAPEAARAAARRPTENEWQVSSSSPSGETDDEQPSRTRQRRDVHAHARDTNDSGGGAAGDNATSRMKRAAQI